MPVTKVKETLLSNAAARRLAKLWQRRLRLSDWSTSVSVVRAKDMSSESSLAECEYNLNRKTATITLLNPADHNSALHSGETRDMEADLVHELLHLHFSPFFPVAREEDNPSRLAQEQAIDLISFALVHAYREAERAKKNYTLPKLTKVESDP